MKKGILGIVCCCFLLAVPALSFAATGWYGSGNVGFAMLSDSDISLSGTDGIDTVTIDGEVDFDGGYVLGGAIGYMFDNFRIEGEVSYQENDVDSVTINSITVNGVDQGLSGTAPADGEISILTFLGNVYFDFNIGSKFTPFITAGAGMANVDVDSDDDTLFAYQVGAGVAYAMSETVTLDCRYRYLGTEDLEESDIEQGVLVTGDASIASHNFTVGLRMNF